MNSKRKRTSITVRITEVEIVEAVEEEVVEVATEVLEHVVDSVVVSVGRIKIIPLTFMETFGVVINANPSSISSLIVLIERIGMKAVVAPVLLVVKVMKMQI